MIVAEYSDSKQTRVELLAYGNRGYISYSEDDLCKLFDKVFNDQIEKVNEKRLKIAEDIKDSHGSKWKIQVSEKELAELEQHVAKFQAIADQVFEEKFLL